MIVAAAIFQDGKIYTGRRHCDVIHSMVVDYNLPTPIEGIQGFVDEDGKFYTRQEAYEYVIKIGQLTKDYKIYSVLMSEDLW